jgi:hypothetical protein
MADAPMDRAQLAATFWGAVLLSVILAWIPGGHYALYPFVLLGTWAHELGHGLAALALGGRFDTLELRPDLGGVAHIAVATDLQHALTSAAGLLGPSLVGGLIIVLGARAKTAPGVLAALGLCLLASVGLWIRDAFGVAAVTTMGLVCVGLAAKAPLSLRAVTSQLVGIQVSLASLNFDYMFTSTFSRDGATMKSDTQAMADALVLPYWVWGALIAALTLAILGASFWFAWMRGPHKKR